MPAKPPDLESAYALQTPQDNQQLYADWAQTYDESFAKDMDYQMPRLVALIFAEVAGDADPVLDVGAGTGLLAAAIPVRDRMRIDALDISPEMLAVAQGKGIYRRCIVGDLTGRLDIPDAAYGAVVSSGTFTHGHVGPDALDELLRVARPGAVFVLSVNAEHFEARGFAAKFDTLGKAIEGLHFRDVNIYGAAADAAHRDDTARIAVFFKR